MTSDIGQLRENSKKLPRNRREDARNFAPCHRSATKSVPFVIYTRGGMELALHTVPSGWGTPKPDDDCLTL